MSDATLSLVRDAFEDEVRGAGGTVQSAHVGAERMMLRAILPVEGEVRPRDRVRGGVALRCDACRAVAVHPYAFRLVCSNGAIFAYAAESKMIVLGEVSPHALEHEVRYATRACCADAAFESAAELMRRSRTWRPDSLLTVVDMLRRHSGLGARTIDSILNEYGRGGDHTGFGVMNAVTAVARRARAPEKKWQLEELGGAVPALAFESARRGPGHADATADATCHVARAQSRELVAV
jgi:hypothetical protein